MKFQPRLTLILLLSLNQQFFLFHGVYSTKLLEQMIKYDKMLSSPNLDERIIE